MSGLWSGSLDLSLSNTGLWSGLTGLSSNNGLWGSITYNPSLNLDFLTNTTLDPRITFSRTTNATLVDATGRVTYAPNNLALRSEEFDNAAWGKTASTITANATTAPNGTATADKLVENTAVTTGHFTVVGVSVTAGQFYILSVYAKAAERTFIQLIATGVGPAAVNLIAGFDLTNGTAGTPSPTLTSAITSVGDGWYRCSIAIPVATTTALGSLQIRLSLNNTSTPSSYTGDGTSGAFIWGAQFEQVTYQTLPSTYVQTVASAYYGPRFDYNPVTLAPRGLLIEEQRTNSIRNSIGVGAVAGTPGTAPTNWAVAGSGVGFTREIVGTGMENGVSYIDVRFFGTPTANFGVAIAFEGANTIAATSGQTWTNSAYVKLQAGSFVGTQTTLSILGTDGAAGTESFGTANITSTPSNLAASRLSLTATLANALTTVVQPRVRIAVTNGVPFDITLRIGLPQMELGAFATSVIPTATAQVTRAADVATMTGANFSSWYNASEGTIVASADSVRPAATSPATRVFQFDDGTVNNNIRSGSTATLQVVDAGVTQVNITATPAITFDGTVFKFASAYKLNDFATVTTGAVATDTSGTVPTVTQLSLGGPSTSGVLNGHIRTFTFYPSRLANAQMQALAS